MSKASGQQLADIANRAVVEFRGDVHELEGAIGALFVGQQVGWRVLLLIHERRTLRKYDKILGVNLREIMPEIGPCADKSLAWKAVQKLGNFWKVVRGEVKGVRTPELGGA